MLSGGAEGSILLWDLERVGAENTTRRGGGGELVYRPVGGIGKYGPRQIYLSLFLFLRKLKLNDMYVAFPGPQPRINSVSPTYPSTHSIPSPSSLPLTTTPSKSTLPKP